MAEQSIDVTNLTALLEPLRAELAALRGRVAALEAARQAPPAPVPEAVKREVLSQDLVLVISAAVAAYLGKKAPIRQIRLAGSPAWVQQGRVTVQALHQLA